MNKRTITGAFAILLTLLVFMIQEAAAEDKVDAGAQPLVLEFNSGGMTQEVIVEERSSFRTVTQVDESRWEVTGKVGTLVDEVLPVELKFRIEHWDHGGSFQLNLKVNENLGYGGGSGPGSTFGMSVATGIWLRRGLDPVPSMVDALSYRDRRFPIAAHYLGKLGARGEAAVDDLVRVLAGKNESLDDNDARSVRGLAAQALGNLGPTAAPAVEALTSALADENVYVRIAAARALWKIDSNPLAVPTLEKELEHEQPYLRQRAAEELGKIGPEAKAAVPKLTEALRDWNPWVRHEAAVALGAIGPAASVAESELENLLDDANEPVRTAAAAALEKLCVKPSAEHPLPSRQSDHPVK